jgi:hypothetical protein
VRPTSPPHRPWRHVAILVDSGQESLLALQQVTAVAYDQRTRLTLIAILPAPVPTVALAGICPLRLERDNMAEASRTVRQLAATLPADLPCTTYARCGHTAQQLGPILQKEQIDVVFIWPRPARVSRWLARWTVWRLRHSSSSEFVILGSSGPSPLIQAKSSGDQ